MLKLSSLILAAGQGTRMKSSYPKVLHQLLDRPMLSYVADAAKRAGSEQIAIVVGFKGEQVISALGDEYHYLWQREQLGTGHAVMMAQELLEQFEGDLLILYGDTPLIREETLRRLVALKREKAAAAAILTTKLENPTGYGRMLRNEAGDIVGIIEDKDANIEQKLITEVNTGVYCFEIKTLLEALKTLSPKNAQGEYYLTDVFQVMAERGLRVVGLITEAAAEVMGPNDRIQLANTEQLLRATINEKWMRLGVTFQDPNFTYIGAEVELAADVTILPGTFLLGKTKVGAGCILGPHTRIVDSEIGENSTVQFSQIIEAKIGAENTVGPFAYLRPGTKSASQVKFGDFVEVKNTTIGNGSKIPHLSYIGDAEIGAGVNIGAGTITCNYDGVNKYRTVIHDDAFIGSNTNLVAPVVVGKGATIGAGSTINNEVPEKALGIARSRQENLLNWVSPRERNLKKRE